MGDRDVAPAVALKSFYDLTGKTKPASFLKPKEDDKLGNFKLVEGQKLVSNITDSTISN